MSPQKRNRNKGGTRPQARRPSGRRTVVPPPPGTAANPPDGDDAEETVRDNDDAIVEPGAVAEEDLDDTHEADDDGEGVHDLPEPDSDVTAFWEKAGIDPVLIALPQGAGLTLRCYVSAAEDEEVDATEDDDEIDGEPIDADDDEDAAEDEEEDLEVRHPATVRQVSFHRSGTVEGEAGRVEPRFLGHDGTIYLFGTVEALTAFVGSDAPHDLTDAPGWESVRTAEELDPTPELLNRYDLDLVVDIARGGGEAWGEQEKQTLLLAGEIARDAAAYCELPDVQAMLAPGTPLDSLDDDLRKGGFLARRRLRRYNPDTIALSWRRIIRELAASTEAR